MLLPVCLAALCGADAPVKYARDVRPILADKCFACHGPAKQEGKLRLDDRAAATARGAKAAFVPGQPDAGQWLKRVHATDPEVKMPPPATRKELSAAEIATLSKWIAQGAVYESHWAFQPIAPSAKPFDLDGLLAAALAERGQAFRPEADRSTRIRRASFALTGLPPTLAERDAFLADQRPGAYERMVERYLASPRFGEEMARHWLDLARYGDTHGLHLDNERQIWGYRNWVVDAFNRNLPFDQFTHEQIAGDLLPKSADRDLALGTGFLRCGVTTSEGGSIDEEWLFRNAVERTSAVVGGFLGLTGGCAVCHDHKFDPLTTKEFYSLYAFFHSAADPAMDGNALKTAPVLPLASAAHRRRVEGLQQRGAAARAALLAKAGELKYADPADAPPTGKPHAATEDILFDDEFPPGATAAASPGHPLKFVDAKSGKVHAGAKALHRSDKGLAQDVVHPMPPRAVPANAKFFAHVYLDAKKPPKAVMLQYFTDGWKHRAVWGDVDAISFGAKGTTERFHAGPLPEKGKWVRLEVQAASMGLKPGDQIVGFALTLHGGAATWDRVGIMGNGDPAKDPTRSFRAWWAAQQGKDLPNADAAVAALAKRGPAGPGDARVLRAFYLANVNIDIRPQLGDLPKRQADAEAELAKVQAEAPATFVFRDLAQPRKSFVMLRGQYDQRGAEVLPSTPAFLPPLKKADPKARATRLDLAKWLTAPENPLVARVAANRLWQQFMGVGLVKSSGDFGLQGDQPSHPELLDALAVWYRQHGWDTKAFVRLLVHSRAFRQDSAAPPESWRRDAENRYLGRGPRFRLDAEQLRDNALFVAGLLRLGSFERGAQPYQPPNIWEPVGFAGSNTRFYKQDHAELLYTRSLYVFLKRTAPAPFMANFDAPNREAPCTRRERSNTPLQALQLLNDVQHFEAARAFAERIVRHAPDADARLKFAFRTVLAREPDAAEAAVLNSAYARHLARYQADPAAAKKAVAVGESRPDPALPPAEVAAWALVANTLLNLDETVTRN